MQVMEILATCGKIVWDNQQTPRLRVELPDEWKEVADCLNAMIADGHILGVDGEMIPIGAQPPGDEVLRILRDLIHTLSRGNLCARPVVDLQQLVVPYEV